MNEALARRRATLIAALVVLASIALFAIGLGQPTTPNFDEFHYLPAAREFLQLGTNRNWEHPPLGKLLIAGGMAVFGDNPVGWRAGAALFGALTMGLVFLWASRLFGSLRSAGLATLIVLLAQLHFVQSRIGALDVFSAFFAVLAGFALTEIWRRGDEASRRTWIALGIALGAGAAVKWFGLLLWAAIGLWAFFRFAGRRGFVLLALLGLPAAIYAASFLPLLALRGENYDLGGLVALHGRMWRGMRSVGVASHGYSSEWWSWPLLLRPIWYHYQRSADEQSFRGVFLVGNAVLFWLSPLAVAHAIGVWRRELAARPIVSPLLFLWTALYLLWAVVPRSGGFFYYYYPASFPLCLLLTWSLLDLERRLRTRSVTHLVVAAAAIVFLWFYPVLSGAFEVPVSLSRGWMWFHRWI